MLLRPSSSSFRPATLRHSSSSSSKSSRRHSSASRFRGSNHHHLLSSISICATCKNSLSAATLDLLILLLALFCSSAPLSSLPPPSPTSSDYSHFSSPLPLSATNPTLTSPPSSSPSSSPCSPAPDPSSSPGSSSAAAVDLAAAASRRLSSSMSSYRPRSAFARPTPRKPPPGRRSTICPGRTGSKGTIPITNSCEWNSGGWLRPMAVPCCSSAHDAAVHSRNSRPGDPNEAARTRKFMHP